MGLKGIIAAMLTPLTKEQTINEEVTRQLTDHLIRSGIHGIFVLGTNGEFHLLSVEEKIKIVQIVVDQVNGRVPVIVGTGGSSTGEVIKLSNKMEEIGADALAIITPYFVPPTQEEVINHFEKIAEETSIPILIYNIPSRTGMNLEPETVATLAKIPSIIGIKDSSGQFDNIKQYIDATKEEHFSVFAGTDSLILNTLQAGGAGAVAATANMIPEIVVSIYNNWLCGNIEEAKKAQERLELLRETFKYGTLPSPLKKAVELYGIPVGPPKLPVSELSGDIVRKIEDIVKFYKYRII